VKTRTLKLLWYFKSCQCRGPRAGIASPVPPPTQQPCRPLYTHHPLLTHPQRHTRNAPGILTANVKVSKSGCQAIPGKGRANAKVKGWKCTVTIPYTMYHVPYPLEYRTQRNPNWIVIQSENWETRFSDFRDLAYANNAHWGQFWMVVQVEDTPKKPGFWCLIINTLSIQSRNEMMYIIPYCYSSCC